MSSIPGHSPAAFLARDRSLRVVLAVFEVRLQLVKTQSCGAAEASVVAGHLQFGKHVTHDAGNGSQVGESHHGAVHGTNLLLGKPLCDAGVAEGMLTVRGLRENAHRLACNLKLCSYALIFPADF